MNKRIGKLRIEACKWARENVPIGEYENASDEKFAELIVLECADVVDRAPFGNDYYANRIKKHFGVEK